jgi:hypothetical protein
VRGLTAAKFLFLKYCTLPSKGVDQQFFSVFDYNFYQAGARVF